MKNFFFPKKTLGLCHKHSQTGSVSYQRANVAETSVAEDRRCRRRRSKKNKKSENSHTLSHSHSQQEGFPTEFTVAANHSSYWSSWWENKELLKLRSIISNRSISLGRDRTHRGEFPEWWYVCSQSWLRLSHDLMWPWVLKFKEFIWGISSQNSIFGF